MMRFQCQVQERLQQIKNLHKYNYDSNRGACMYKSFTRK